MGDWADVETSWLASFLAWCRGGAKCAETGMQAAAPVDRNVTQPVVELCGALKRTAGVQLAKPDVGVRGAERVQEGKVLLESDVVLGGRGGHVEGVRAVGKTWCGRCGGMRAGWRKGEH
eukprot:354238-Chlamydomonas_euryale.AAC.3